MKKARGRGGRHFVRLLFIFFLASCSFLVPRFIAIEPYPAFSSTLFFSGNFGGGNSTIEASSNCSSVPKNSICCDRNGSSSDVCALRGDVRTSPSFSSIFLYAGVNGSNVSVASRVEKIRPYIRKRESSVLNGLNELELVVLNRSGDSGQQCDIAHRVPAVVFSTGEFRDCIIPLYIASYRFNRRVVFLVVNYRTSWRAKYQEILSRLSAYPPVDFLHDNRTRCFPEMTVGLRVQSDLASQTIHGFRRLLDKAYGPRIRYLERKEKRSPVEEGISRPSAPKLVIIFEKGSRAIQNEKELAELCEEMGFKVQVLRPQMVTELAEIYRVLNKTDAVLDVLGRYALTHLLFTRPGGVFIQVLVREDNNDDLAKAIGLEYITYKINTRERGTELGAGTKRGRLDLSRLLSRLTRAYQHIVERKMEENNSSLNWNQNWTPRRSLT